MRESAVRKEERDRKTGIETEGAKERVCMAVMRLSA